MKHKTVWNKKLGKQEDINLSAIEVKEISDREALELKEKPMIEWQGKMSKTDDLPRWAEDIIDVLTATQKTALSKKTKDKYENKKLIRAEKPV